MSWAEFQIRLIGFKRVREHQTRLFREVGYQSYLLQFIMSKKSPKKINDWWPIGKKKETVLPEEIKEVFMQQRREYEEKVKKNG